MKNIICNAFLKKLRKNWGPSKSKLVKHAERELELAGMLDDAQRTRLGFSLTEIDEEMDLRWGRTEF